MGLREELKKETESLKDVLAKGDVKLALIMLLSDGSKFENLEDITNGNVCGTSKAVCIDGRLCYVDDKEVRAYEVEKTKEVREYLRSFINKAELILDYKKISKEDKRTVLTYLRTATGWCLKHGFYGKALDLAKLTTKYFAVSTDVVLERAVRGYAERQLLRGDNCEKKVSQALVDMRRGRYGEVAKINGTQHYLNVFNSVKIVLKNKKTKSNVINVIKDLFAKDKYCTFDMDDYKDCMNPIDTQVK